MTVNDLAPATAKKYSKVSLATGAYLRFPRALLEIAKVSSYGCTKHQKPMGDMSYLDVPDAEHVFANAEARHMAAEVLEGPVNHADGDLPHKAQKAWNALADLEVFLYQREKAGK